MLRPRGTHSSVVCTWTIREAASLPTARPRSLSPTLGATPGASLPSQIRNHSAPHTRVRPTTPPEVPSRLRFKKIPQVTVISLQNENLLVWMDCLFWKNNNNNNKAIKSQTTNPLPVENNCLPITFFFFNIDYISCAVQYALVAYFIYLFIFLLHLLAHEILVPHAC